MGRGLLIVFEGSEGAGKTTQVARLARYLDEAAIDHLVLREPGGTRVGEGIRQILLDPAQELAPETESLLFMASRAELVSGLVRPALESGKAVVLDRFFLSTYAYQVAGRGLPEAEIRVANRLATGGLVPDLTILLRIDPVAGLARALQRSARDRMEQTGVEFHGRVAEAFTAFAQAGWQQAHPECGEIMSVDAARDEDAVHEAVLAGLRNRWPERFPGTPHAIGG